MSAVIEQLKNEPNNTKRNIAIIVAIFLILVWSANVLDYNSLTVHGKTVATNIIRGIFNPSKNLIFTTSKTGVPWLIIETISIAFLGTIIGAILAIPLAFVSSKNIVSKKFAVIGLSIIVCIRTVPVFILGLMFIRVSGPGAFAGVLTMTVSSLGMISKLYIESIEELDKGILEFLDATGSTTYQKVVYGVIPQLSSNFVSTAIYRFEINIKNASVLGLVGAGGIGFPLLSAMQNNRWSDAGAYLSGLIIMVIIIEILSTKIRKRLSYGS